MGKEFSMKRYEKLIQDPGAREADVLAFWEQQETFAKSLDATRGAEPFVFFEGPPTANGKPHIGHLMPRVYKDLFPRFRTMSGQYVLRKAGWDTHGLPVELEVEKAIGVNSKPEIEAYGVERFVEKCKESVWRYKADWERMMKRMGFWIDFENAYVTYTDDYIETLWWELKLMFDRGLLYQGHKTLPYCPRCGTGLSSHEVAQGYKTVEDLTVTVRLPVVEDVDANFQLSEGVRTSLLTWTTTPWTLPANVAAAVSPEATYVEVRQGEEHLLLVKTRLEEMVRGDYEIVREWSGSELVGLRYSPPYALTSDPAAHRVYAADFVNLEDGTGIVHIASAFGEDDYRLGQEVGLPFFQPVDLAGCFTEEFPLGAGVFVKEVDPRIVEDLDERGVLYASSPYEHEYPFCWRCDTPLLYYARDSWYIRTTEVKEQMIALNASIRWHPSHVGEGRLAGFLAGLKDWALSRDRFWGTPLNLWVCEDCERVTSVGSRTELVEHAQDAELAREVEFHRPYIDRVTLSCPGCKGTARRVPYVIDTWFDSGSMHSAQWHYPFENREQFEENFPADFICEAMEQTRGWFYTLLATSTIVHGQAPFRNCIGTGLGLDANGLKMSKSKGNVLDPWEAIDSVGADCLRWYLYSSSAPWKSKRLGDAEIKEPLYRFLDTARNVHDFFALYASIDGYDPAVHSVDPAFLTVLDRWLVSRVSSTTQVVRSALDAYDVVTATSAMETWMSDLSNWYIRLSRRRFWRGGMGPDKMAAYGTLRAALIAWAKLAAPFIPFLSEAVYRSLRGPKDEESVHLCGYPDATGDVDGALEAGMAWVRQAVALGHQARNVAQLKVRQPLSGIFVERPRDVSLSGDLLQLMKTELNVESVQVIDSMDTLGEERPVPNYRSLGPRLGGQAPTASAWIREQSAESLRRLSNAGPISAEKDNHTFELRSEDILYERTLPDHLVLSEEGGVRIVLDTELNEALRRKGLVRELTHRIQLARKNAGFDVVDRVHVTFSANPPLDEVVRGHLDEIAEEILAESLVERASVDGEHTEQISFDGMQIRVGLSRVSVEDPR